MKPGRRIDVAVLGAVGVVGEIVLDMLAQRGFPVRRLYPLGTGDEVGEAIAFGKETPVVLDAAAFDWRQAQLAFFVADDRA
ncbi:MAG TPA: aspartate-semialdehyde dehydrogenase, partial [Betaproteobacteria bacterium]|nr:aspartate-semialdehyde dehydrogenase [Betaproteobacteria bacterium]